jgi:3-phenylpropionate/trans-cinnamate dioxygenase ferredoxin subunit
MTDFVSVCKVDDLPEGVRKVVDIDERFILVFHVDGQFYAIDDMCTHDGGPLGDGFLDGFTIACPRHGAKFDIRDGRVLCMPAVCGTPSHEVKIEGGQVFVKINTRPPKHYKWDS